MAGIRDRTQNTAVTTELAYVGKPDGPPPRKRECRAGLYVGSGEDASLLSGELLIRENALLVKLGELLQALHRFRAHTPRRRRRERSGGGGRRSGALRRRLVLAFGAALTHVVGPAADGGGSQDRSAASDGHSILL
jgi:hypothetical protein